MTKFEIGMFVGAFAVVFAVQPILVSLGHPHAVWLWCDMAKLC